MLKYVETKNAPAAIGPYSQGSRLQRTCIFLPVRFHFLQKQEKLSERRSRNRPNRSC